MMLDTVCNVFGAVVLMGVLVVVHTPAGAARFRELAEETALKEIDAREIQLEIDQLQAEIDQLATDVSEYQARYAQTVTPDKAALAERYEEKVAILASIERQLKRANSELASAEDRLQEVEEDIVDHKEDLDQIDQQIRSAVAQADTAEKQVERLIRQAKRRPDVQDQIRLPWTHKSTAPIQINFVILDDRVYPVDGYHCREVPPNGPEGKYVTVTGRGFPVIAGAANRSFLQHLKGNGRTHYVTFWLHATEESFKTVQILRRIVASRRYEFGYAVQPPGRPIQWIRGDGEPVQ